MLKFDNLVDGEIINIKNDYIIKKLVYNKFKKLYNDNGSKNNYEITGKTFKFDNNIIKFELNNLEKEKAISWDYIPVKVITGLIGKNEDENEKVINKIKQLFELIISPDYPIPEVILSCRLITLNKDISGKVTLEKIKPISIYGPYLNY